MDAITRIKQLGMPRRNNELWTFFPVAKIPAPEFPDACTSSDDFSQETDFAALLPVAQNARTMVQNIADGSEEMAMLKCNNDYGHTVLNIGKNAKASIEILDNKVQHPICGNGITRVSIDAFLNAPGASFDARTLNVLGGESSSHHRLHIYHNAPETTSTQLSRNLLDGNATASYDGSVIVGNGCTKAYSSQLVNTILLSENSSVSVKPVLKIYHDDVECTHGNTIGELDAEQMFYLVSRGIPEKAARKMLISSFAKETFYPLPDSPAKKRLLQALA